MPNRCKEWIAARSWKVPAEEALGAYDGIVGLDLSDAALADSQQTVPMRGEERSPVRPTSITKSD